MSRSGPAVLRTVLGICLIVVVIVALVVPWKKETLSMCQYCGASARELRILSIPCSVKVTEGELSRYWRRNVDAHHQHRWDMYASHSVGLLDGGYADSFVRSPVHTILEDEKIIAILSALPNPSARLTFMNGLVGSWQGTSAGKAIKTARKLQIAYDADPNRKDWPEVLRKLGCYPVTGGKP